MGNELLPIFAGMKTKNFLILLIIALIFSAHLASCGEDRRLEYAEQTKTDEWIDDTMRVYYYWYDEMPRSSKLNYFAPPFEFFATLLSSKDGKNNTPYSTIDSLKTSTRSISDTENSYGFQFALASSANSSNQYYAQILYVVPGSPASDINLKRGDWILKVDGEAITANNYGKLLSGSARTLHIGHYDAESNQLMANTDNPVSIAASRTVDDNPVHYYNTYTKGDRKIGYLVYNHFTAGATEGSQEYNTSLRTVSSYFASQQVTDFILDLRYNNGGLLSCAQLLCTLLAPSGSLGKELGYLQYNDRFNPRTVSFSLDNNLIQGGSNLNLSKLYVLTTGQTASSSEVIINCLKPYMDVVVIGQTTEGKNVGSISFSNQELQIKISPIVCQLFNSKGESSYAGGFSPDYTVNESSNLSLFLPFGEEKEALLSVALGLIEGYNNTESVSASATRSATIRTTLFNSIDRRATGAVRIR